MTKTCINCEYSTTGDYGCKTFCAWEKHFLPPPVFRSRNWGKNAPETWDEAAEKCKHYEARNV